MNSVMKVIGLSLVFGVLLFGAAGADAEPVVVSAGPVALDAAAPGRVAVGALRYLGGFALQSKDKNFGGLSGLEFTDEGRTLIAVSDQAHLFRMRLLWRADGRFGGLGAVDKTRLKRQGGGVLKGKTWRDAEAVALEPGGDLIVAFERNHRLRRYGFSGFSEVIDTPKALAYAPANGGIEALAVLGDGRMVMFSEALRDGDLIVGWIGAWGAGRVAWTRLGLVPSGDFRPTGLAALPDGNLVLLERAYSVSGGARARLSLVRSAVMTAGSRILGRELARLQPPLSVDNFEGVAARRGGGGVVIALVSDNNFSPRQRTLLMMFHLADK